MLTLAVGQRSQGGHGARRGRARADSGLRRQSPRSARPRSRSASTRCPPSLRPLPIRKLAAAFAGRGRRSATSSSRRRRPRAGRRRSGSRSAPALRAPATAGTADAALLPRRSARSTPASYNLGVAVGWRRFAVAGDVGKSKEADPALGGRESAALGVSYSVKQLHRPRRGRRRARRRTRARRRCARPTIIRSTSAAPTS